MNRMVSCVLLKRKAEGLATPPHPGQLGQRIYQEVSKEGWSQWLERLTTIINENGINTADSRSMSVVEGHMKGFLFGEGDLGGVPQGFKAKGSK